jgi:hypothetical protein
MAVPTVRLKPSGRVMPQAILVPGLASMAVPTGRLKHSGQIISQIMSVPGVVVSGRLMAVPGALME